jgi:NitT/TauT family transport system ATP-binding protein
LEQPSAGTLLVNGVTPEIARRQRAYGYVFQAPGLYAWRTVERNVMLPLEIMGLPPAERRERARTYLELVGLQTFARRFPWQLSGGMQQRVSIARALSFEPTLLLMDEPFGALDEITRDGLNGHLRELWQRTGMTIVFVTHSIPEAVYLSTRIVVMSARPGRIVDVLESDLGAERPLAIRDTPAFAALGHRVRSALHAGSDDA